MRRGMMVLSAAFALAMKANAMGNGFYLGIMMGPATNNGRTLEAQVNPVQLNPPQDPATAGLITTPANPRSNQFGTRIYMGNQFSQYAAIEGGVTLFSSIRYDARGVPVYGGTDQRVRSLDIMGKGMMPLATFTIYGKLGVAVTYLTTGGALNPTFTPQNPPPPAIPITPAVTSGSNTYKNKFSPAYSLGASYDLNQSWQMDLSYNTIQVGNNLGAVTLYAIGISYHFTDKYCGQFLCDD